MPAKSGGAGHALCAALAQSSLDRISLGLLIACKAAENWLCGQQWHPPLLQTALKEIC